VTKTTGCSPPESSKASTRNNNNRNNNDIRNNNINNIKITITVGLTIILYHFCATMTPVMQVAYQ
jgi:hypothetical protein